MQSAISSGTRLWHKIVACFLFMQSKPGSFCEIAAAATYISVSAESRWQRAHCKQYSVCRNENGVCLRLTETVIRHWFLGWQVSAVRANRVDNFCICTLCEVFAYYPPFVAGATEQVLNVLADGNGSCRYWGHEPYPVLVVIFSGVGCVIGVINTDDMSSIVVTKDDRWYLLDIIRPLVRVVSDDLAHVNESNVWFL